MATYCLGRCRSETSRPAKSFVDAVNRGDVEAAIRVVHPEMIFEPLRAATEGTFVGHDGLARFLRDTTETFELFRVEHIDIRDRGDRVLAIGSIRIRGRESGVETDIPTASVSEFRDGLLRRYKDYGDADAALEAVGLSERAVSQAHAEIVRQVVEAVNRRDAKAFVARVSPDVEWEDSVFWTEGSRTYRGKAEVRERFDRILEPFESVRMWAEEIDETGDGRLFVGFGLAARGKESGAATQLRFWTVSRIEAGKIATRKAFLERAEALAAAGLAQ